ncbi:MAG: hypothetical protein ACAI44_06425 [Candidatus Sericytochromatia bacterium]
MPRQSVFYGMIAALTAGVLLSGCAGVKAATQRLQRLEYYQRWTRPSFPQASSARPGLGASAALAELPPQYQSAFSLVLEPDAVAQALDAEYHFQMVADPATHKQAKQRLGAEAYRRLMELVSQPMVCEASVEPGWAGPAPEILSLDYGERSDSLYVGGPNGPAGPGQELRSQNKRRYLCNDQLLDFLGEVVSKLKPS